ncbi:hypothetical protein BTZ20_0738 [Rhodococcus sp. MTM3W5.2]|nr:hypothetical protein [Rhodococcus sp. MTM3W5.2]AQA25158.1 hypothetical protein BTZ20_0738 [Rhodococcus sp. MTM3W5.2]
MTTAEAKDRTDGHTGPVLDNRKGASSAPGAFIAEEIAQLH